MNLGALLPLLAVASAVLVLLAAGATFAMRRGRALGWWRPIYSRRADHLWPPAPAPDFAYAVPAGDQDGPAWERELPGGGSALVITRHLRRVGPEGLNHPGGLPGATLCGLDLGGGNPDLPERGREIVFWPKEGEAELAACHACQQVRNTLAEEHYAAHLDPLLTKGGRRYYQGVRARQAARW